MDYESSSFNKEPDNHSASSMGNKSTSKKSNNKGSLLIWVLIIIILLIAIGGGVYYYIQYQKSQQLLKNPALGAQMESQNLIAKVGSLMELPKGENPTIATISDITKLRNQAFFANAQNGDKVLIYPKAKKAILYRPSTNKIINVAPINISASSTVQPVGAVTITPPVSTSAPQPTISVPTPLPTVAK